MESTAHPRPAPAAPQPTRPPDLIRWGPVVAGAAIGLAVFALLSTLWLAIAAGPGADPVQANLPWFMGPTAAFALLLAGVIAGLFAGARGALAGLANGVTAWALLFVLSLTAIVPGAANLTAGLGSGLGQGQGRAGGALGGVTAEGALWAGFWSLLVGLVLAGLGGMIGGRARRPAGSSAQPAAHSGAADTDPGTTPVPAATPVPEQRRQETVEDRQDTPHVADRR